MNVIEGISRVFKAVKERSPRSHSVLLYLLFLLISCILWSVVTMSNDDRYKLDIPVTIVDIPANVHLLAPAPKEITVSVTGRSSTFLKYYFSARPHLKLRFADYKDANGYFKVDNAQLVSAVNSIIKLNVTNVLPSHITIPYTDRPGKKVPVMLDVDAKPAPSYAFSGSIECIPDSVVVYGDADRLKEVNEVYSYHVKVDGLTDTLVRTVTIAGIKGVLIEPRAVQVKIPVENLVTKTQKVQIEVCNAPSNVNVILFPSTVDASFLVPFSMLRDPNIGTITAVVDYNSINLETPGNKVEVLVGEVPGYFVDVNLSMDSVEYIIEKH
ncbi:MAG: CdaR family protein [Muribaculaceae bacterium]|nr:CdaR family protein [Muribaculaceae bacterium]